MARFHPASILWSRLVSPKSLNIGDLVTYKTGQSPYGYSLGAGLVLKMHPDLRDGDRCSVLWTGYPSPLLESTVELETL